MCPDDGTVTRILAVGMQPPPESAVAAGMDPAEIVVSDAPPPKISVAMLDADGLFLGVQEIDPASKLPEQIEVPADCDLKPGRCKWVAIDGYPGGGRFEYFGGDAQAILNDASAVSSVSMEIAFNALATALQQQGVPLPQATLAWMSDFAQSIDAH